MVVVEHCRLGHDEKAPGSDPCHLQQSVMDLLNTAEPISQAGNSCVINIFQRVKKCFMAPV